MKRGNLIRNFVSRFAIMSLAMTAMGCADGPNKERSTGTSDAPAERQRANTDKAVLSESLPEPDSAFYSGEDSVTEEDLNSLVDDSLEALEEALAEEGEDPNMDFAADPELSDDAQYMEDEDDGHIQLSDSDMDIEKDRLIATTLVRVLKPDFADQRDSALSEVEKRLSITPERIPATVVVEKWISPVNFKGYKFNQRKLILFGVRDEQRVAIFYYVNHYYFALGERFYELDEALAFEPFQNLVDTALVRHLRTYETSL